MTPPSVVPCPPMNFVRECTTMSAPYSIGRSRIGVATVLSTISGTPCLWATRASASMSQMFPAGLPTVSQKTARVWSSISFSISSGTIGLREADSHSLTWQKISEQRVRGPVELRNRDDVSAQLRHVERGIVSRGLPRADAQGLQLRPRARRRAARVRPWSGC